MKYRVEVTFKREQDPVIFMCDDITVNKTGLVFLKNVLEARTKLGDVYISQHNYLYISIYEMD